MEKNTSVAKELLVYIIMLLCSIIFIIVGIVYKNIMFGSIILNIGLSIMSTVIIYLLLKFLSDDPMQPIINKIDIVSKELSKSVDLLNDVGETGVSRVWNTRSDFPINEWISRIENADGDIKIFCYAMAFLIDDSRFDAVVKQKIKEGKRIQVLLGKPDGKCIIERTIEENSEGNIGERIQRACARLKNINKSLDEKNTNCIEIRYHDTPLYSSIYIFGDSMIVTPQLYGQRGAKAPIIELKQVKNMDCLYNKYYEMFDQIWRDESESVDG